MRRRYRLTIAELVIRVAAELAVAAFLAFMLILLCLPLTKQ